MHDIRINKINIKIAIEKNNCVYLLLKITKT